MDTKLSRRDFLKLAGSFAVAPALPAWTPRMAFAPEGVEPPGDILVVVFQRGGMDGISALKQLKASAATRSIPVMAITASAMTYNRESMLAEGFDGYQTKPISLKDFLGEIERVLAGRGKQ